MENIISLATVLFLSCVVHHQTLAVNISCNTCNGTSDGSVSSVACGSASTGSLNTTNGCAVCSTVIQSNGTFSRQCLLSSNRTNGCIVTSANSTFNSSCYCSSNNCNNQNVFYGLGEYTCYVCTSVDYMDNGCGVNFNSASQYVQQMTGCLACGKNVTASPGGGLYTRSCLNTVEPPNLSCVGTVNACSFRCHSNLCNESPTIRSSTVTTVTSLLLVVLSAICVRLG